MAFVYYTSSAIAMHLGNLILMVLVKPGLNPGLKRSRLVPSFRRFSKETLVAVS